MDPTSIHNNASFKVLKFLNVEEIRALLNKCWPSIVTNLKTGNLSQFASLRRVDIVATYLVIHFNKLCRAHAALEFLNHIRKEWHKNQRVKVEGSRPTVRIIHTGWQLPQSVKGSRPTVRTNHTGWRLPQSVKGSRPTVRIISKKYRPSRDAHDPSRIKCYNYYISNIINAVRY